MQPRGGIWQSRGLTGVLGVGMWVWGAVLGALGGPVLGLGTGIAFGVALVFRVVGATTEHAGGCGERRR